MGLKHSFRQIAKLAEETDSENCRFVSHRVNQHNKSTSRMGTIDGETKCVAAWALDPRCSVPYQTVLARLRYGWDIRDAVLKPAKWFRKRKIS